MKVNIPDMETTLGMLCTVLRHHSLEIPKEEKAKDDLFVLHPLFNRWREESAKLHFEVCSKRKRGNKT